MNSSIQNKLSSFAPEPPKGVWEAIEEALDEQVSPVLSQKLAGLQASPPANAWEKISAQLDTATEAPVVPLFRKRTFLRYAAAAAFVLIAGSAVLFVNQKGSGVPPVSSSPVANTTGPVTSPAPSVSAAAEKPEATEVAGEKLAKSPGTRLQSIEGPEPGRRKTTMAYNSPVPLEALAFSHQYVPVDSKSLRTEPLAAPEEKFLEYTDGDGRTMKLPRKLYDFMNCVTRDFDCQQRLRQWQQAMATATLSTDFTGVLEIIRNLGENQ